MAETADASRNAADHYRRKAAECRNKADHTNDDWARQSLLEFGRILDEIGGAGGATVRWCE